MRLGIIILAMFFMRSYGFAQDFSVKWSELERVHGQLIYLLPIDSSEFYALRWSGSRMFGSYQVSRHKDLQHIATKRIRLVVEESIATFEGARVFNGKFFVFLSDKRNGQNHFYMQEYTKELEPAAEPIKLASYDLEGLRSTSYFDIKLSSNKQFLGVIWEIPGKKGERDIYGFKVFNTAMEEMNEGEYPLPFDAELSTIHAHHISNRGDYFMALSESEVNTDRRIFQDRLKFKALHIYHIAEDGLQDYTLNLKDRRVEAMAMTSDDKNIFTITGIYGDAGAQGVSGIFIQRADLNEGKVLSESYEPFSEEFITQGWTERELKKQERMENRGRGDLQLYNYRMREAKVMADGSIIGMMEQYYVQVRSFSDARSGQTSNSYYYYYNDIIVYKIASDGTFEWTNKIPKYQVSSNDGGPFSSYETIVSEGKAYFMFNDNIQNYNEIGEYIGGDRSVYTANFGKRKNAVAFVEIDLATGDQHRRTFFDQSELDVLVVPKLFDVNYSSRRMLLYSIWGRKEKIGVMKF